MLRGRSKPPLWSSGKSSWIQIQRSAFDSRRYQIFWEVVDLERGPLSLVNTIEELLERKSSGSGLEIREYGGRDPSRWPRGTLYPQKLALTSLTSGGRSVGIVLPRTHAMEFYFIGVLTTTVLDIICRPVFHLKKKNFTENGLNLCLQKKTYWNGYEGKIWSLSYGKRG
jgi:hypothetical protein